MVISKLQFCVSLTARSILNVSGDTHCDTASSLAKWTNDYKTLMLNRSDILCH